MANEVNIYTPRYLAEVVRQAPPVHTFFRDTFFTNVKKSTTERVDIDLVKGDRRMAAFVHPRVGGKVLKASGYKTESYKPPLVNPCDITTADRYMTRMPGEDLYSGETPAQRSAQQLMEEYSRLNDATTRREEWMAVRTIMDGQIPVVGPGVNKVIDFGFTNKVTLEKVDTSDTEIYPVGGGAGTMVKIQAWIDLPLTPTIANSGNEQQTTTFQAIQHERAVNINTYKSAATQTFTMAHDASAPVREVLKKLDRSQDVTAFKFYNKRAKETRVYGCQVSFNEIPASEVNNVETNSLVLSRVSEMVIYPAA